MRWRKNEREPSVWQWLLSPLPSRCRGFAVNHITPGWGGAAEKRSAWEAESRESWVL
jgi:hypothetical protein